MRSAQALAFLRSLSLGSGALLTAGACAVLGLLVAFVRSRQVRWALAVALPAAAAYALYWAPVWLGADPSEYSAWFFVCFVPWFLSGTTTAFTVVFVTRRIIRFVTEPSAPVLR